MITGWNQVKSHTLNTKLRHENVSVSYTVSQRACDEGPVQYIVIDGGNLREFLWNPTQYVICEC